MKTINDNMKADTRRRRAGVFAAFPALALLLACGASADPDFASSSEALLSAPVASDPATLTVSETIGPILKLPGVEPEVQESLPDCTPRPPMDRDRCHPEEPAPAPPAVDGYCDVEVMVKRLEYEDGQGASEGKAEASVIYTATDSRTGGVSVQRVPEVGSLKLQKEKSLIINLSLGVYRVPENRRRQVEVCADFTEHDDDLLNGKDDLGSDCETLTLTCPQAGDSELLYADLCRGGDCDKLNGAMSSEIEVLAKDADRDCVENEDDYTPEPCDEALKGQLCRGSLVYFHYGDGPITDLAQNFGTDLSKATGGYDEVVLLVDDAQVGPFGLNSTALSQADVVMPPIEENFFAGLQELTALGCDIDVWMFSHGTVEWQADGLDVINLGGSVTALSDDDGEPAADITTLELAEDADPLNSGTQSVPVRMTYSTACYYGEWNQTWLDVGAKVVSGSSDVNFFPLYYGNFADDWNGGDTYGASLAGESNSVDEGLSLSYVSAQGLLPPWACLVLEENDCSDDFFVDSDLFPNVNAANQWIDGPDEAMYSLGGPLWDTVGIVYDPTLSGLSNMRAASAKIPAGDLSVRKNVPPTLRWR